MYPTLQINRPPFRAALLPALLALLLAAGCGRAGPDADASADADAPADPDRLLICVTGTDAREVVRAVARDRAEIVAFVGDEQDPHVVEPTTGMIETLARADLLVAIGLGMEDGWLPRLVEASRNTDAAEGGSKRLELDRRLRTIAGPEGRGVPGSFHPEDNPHFLADPVEAAKAAELVADTLARIDPDHADSYRANAASFVREIAELLVGPDLAAAIDSAADLETLAIAVERDEFDRYAARNNLDAPLAGLLARAEPFRDTPVVGDHDMWPYFARRLGVRVADYLEPEPGVPPTTRHLQTVIDTMREQGIRVVLTVPYLDPSHARFVRDQTGAEVLAMAHQPGGRPGTDSYLEFARFNIETLLSALEDAGDDS